MSGKTPFQTGKSPLFRYKLQYSRTHFPNIMGTLNSLKKDGCLCDIDIIVGDNRIPAHKCILAAGSDYFKSLFCGPLKQDLSEVNLSTVTDDFESVVSVIDFLYTGDINVDDENLEIILKLSSFLLISMLRGMCISYMETSLDLDNCIQFYLLAAEFMIPELEQNLSKTVSSRFHDFLIFRDSSLKVIPNQLKFLMESCKIFEYCSYVDIISFIIDWVAAGKTEEHEQMGCQVLDFVEGNVVRPHSELSLEQQCSAVKEKIQFKLEYNSECVQFIMKLNSIINECLAVAEIESSLLTNELTSAPESIDQEMSVSDTEPALIAFAPNRRLIFFIEGNVSSRSQYAIRNGQALFDICVYIPRKKMWYHVTEGYREKAFKKMSNRDTYNIADGVVSCLMGDRICFASPDEALLYIYDLNSFTWKEIDYEDLVEDLDNDEFNVPDDTYFVYSGEKLYLFLRNRVSRDDKNDQINYECHFLSSEDTWNYMFVTPMLEDEYSEMHGSQFSVAISETSNEMMLLYKIDTFHVFIVDLETIETSETTVRHLQTDYNIKGSKPLHILEDGEHFAIVEESRNADNENVFRCACRYKLKTKELITDIDSEVKVDGFYPKKHFLFSPSPCDHVHTANDKRHHLWLSEGNDNDGSSLKSVSFEDKVCSHTPPPFSCVSGMVAGEIKRECLASLQPITKYLHEEVRGYIPSEGEYSPSD